MKLTVRPGLEFRRLGVEGIVLDPMSGVFCRLSPDAAFQWELLARGDRCDLESVGIRELSDMGLIVEGSSKQTAERPLAPREDFGLQQAFLVRASCGTTVFDTKPSSCPPGCRATSIGKKKWICK
jgi:hypothetical protein